MKVEAVKGLVLAALFVMTFALGMVPVFLLKVMKRGSETFHKRLVYTRAISWLSCFAAGVFLATCLLDLLPTVRVKLGTVLNSMDVFTSFPVAEFVMMFGLFMILIVEQIVLSVKERHLHEETVRKPLINGRKRLSEPYLNRTASVGSEHSIAGISDEPHSSRFTSSYPGVSRNLGSSMNDPAVIDCDDDLHQGYSTEEDENHPQSLPQHNHSSLRSVLLLIALSLHSVFEGLAVGLQKSADDVLGIFAALVIHKSILSFSLGMNLIQSKLTQGGVVRSILFFSLTAPVGVGIGIGITDLWDSQSSSLVQGLLSGIACGTFLYVTFFEVLPCEFNSDDQRLVKVVMLLLGFSTVTAILFLHKDSEPTCYVIPPEQGSG